MDSILFSQITKFCNQRYLKCLVTIETSPGWFIVFCSLYISRLAFWANLKCNFLQLHYFNTDCVNINLCYKNICLEIISNWDSMLPPYLVEQRKSQRQGNGESGRKEDKEGFSLLEKAYFFYTWLPNNYHVFIT